MYVFFICLSIYIYFPYLPTYQPTYLSPYAPIQLEEIK